MIPKSIVPSSWEVPQIFRDRLGDDFGRQRVMIHEGHLLLILHGPADPEDIEREGRLFWRNPKGEWHSTLKGGVSALKNHLGEFEEILLELEKMEIAASTPNDYFQTMERLGPICRTASHLYEVLSDARKAIPDARELIVLRDKSYELSRTAELSLSSAKNGMEFTIAKKTEEHANASHAMSVASHRLNLLAAFFFPLVTIASLFGTDLIPVEPQYATSVLIVLIALGLISGGILTHFISRPAKKEGK